MREEMHSSLVTGVLSELFRYALLSDQTAMLMGTIKIGAEGFSHDFQPR